MTDTLRHVETTAARPSGRPQIIHHAIIAGSLILVLALFARIMTYPVNHDEQIHIAASRLVWQEPLYRTLGYNHLPDLPLVLGSIYALTGTDHLLLVGRLLIFAAWLATGAILVWIAHRAGAGRGAAIIACLLLASTELLGTAGMLVTNNFLPIPFALVSIQCLLCAVQSDRAAARWSVLAGAAAMMAVLLKVSFVALAPPLLGAALLAPIATGWRGRFVSILLPMAGGAAIAALPAALVILADPGAFFAHTILYFLGPHHDFWQASTAPKAMSLRDKAVIAERVWLSGGAILAAVLAGAFVWIGGAWKASWPARALYPFALVSATAGSLALVSFVPTPAFPQYYAPAVPFVVMLAVVAYGQLDVDARQRAFPFVGVAACLALAVLGPRLGALPALAKPQSWTGIALHREADQIRKAVGRRAEGAEIATLSPIVALESGMRIYPEFAAGPFVYRIAPFIPPADRDRYVTTSPDDIARFLGSRRPLAILVGSEPALEPPFADYARANGYREVSIGREGTRLFVRPE